MKVRDLIAMLEDNGWKLVRQRGSHRQFRHPIKGEVLTVAGKPGDDVARGTLGSLLKKAGLKS